MALREPPLMPYEFDEETRVGPIGVLQAIRLSVVVVLIPIVLLVGGAVTYGLLRKPTYTSEARLNVGGLNLTQQSIQGYTAAVQQLAVAYSRAVDATQVLDPVARRSGLSSTVVADRVSATPVQGSPVIRIIATSKDSAEAVLLADATAGSLVRYAVKLNSGESASSRLLRRFVAASRRARKARAAVLRLKPDDPRRRAAQTREDIALLEQRTAGILYQQSQAGQATTNLVRELAPAAPATDDRWSVLQQLVAGALIAGLLTGVGLAIMRSRRVALRRLARR